MVTLYLDSTQLILIFKDLYLIVDMECTSVKSMLHGFFYNIHTIIIFKKHIKLIWRWKCHNFAVKQNVWVIRGFIVTRSRYSYEK